MKNRSRSKYTIGSLLILLAFLFYMTRNHSLGWIIKSLERNTEKPKNKKGDEGELRRLTAFQGKVTGIKDGDTFEILYDGHLKEYALLILTALKNRRHSAKMPNNMHPTCVLEKP